MGSGTDFRAARILLADDDNDLRAVYASYLRAAGFEVHEATDGPAAIALVRDVRPDLAVLDLWMPGLNGLEVLDRLRHEPAAGRLKVVMLSCLADADVRLESFEAGASSYLVKGLSLADLVGHLRGVLAEAEAATRTIPDPS